MSKKVGDVLISAVEWWKKEGKWICSLICYNGEFTQIWLESGNDLSFKVKPGKYCIGYITLNSRTSRNQVMLEPWKAIEPCPSEANLKKGFKCPSCIRADVVKPCLLCDGTKCLVESPLQMMCHKSKVFVYIASFGLDRVKVGVAHESRIPQRWIEQGANLAKRIIVGNGMEARRFENTIHNSLNVLKGLRTSQKINTLWKNQKIHEETQSIIKVEEEIKKQFPQFPFYNESIHNLANIYTLQSYDRRPIEMKIKKNLQISGKILGTKGSLLLISIENFPHFINLNYLLGRKIELNTVNTKIVQTGLDLF